MPDWITTMLASAAGGIIGGMAVAYSLGMWRGRVDATVKAMQAALSAAAAARKELHARSEAIPELQRRMSEVDRKLEAGADRMTGIAVLEERVGETLKLMQLLRGDVATYREEAEKRYVPIATCAERHRRKPT